MRVRLLTSGVNPSDVKSRAGVNRKIAFPRVIPHSDGAGEIDRVGEGVAASRIGERVWVWNGQWRRAFGTAAEYIVLPAEQAVRLPANVSLEAGACLGIPVYTAYQAVEYAGIGDGSTVLVAAGAGAVGHYVIQFAKKKGATVLTTVSSSAKADLARQAGADHTIDYKREDVGERVMAITGKRGVDAVIEMDLAVNAHLLPRRAAAGRHRRGLWRQRAGTGDPVPVPAAEQHHAAVPSRLQRCRRRCAHAPPPTSPACWKRTRSSTTWRRPLTLADIVAAHEAVEAGKALGNIVLRTG